MTTITEAIAQAHAAAARFPQQLAGPFPMPAPRLTLDAMMVGSIAVDAWLKVGHYGLSIGADTTIFESLDVLLPLDEIAYNFQVKFGNPVTYLKTYDRVTCATGGTWADAMSRAQAIEPTTREYRSADLVFITTGDLLDKKGNLLLGGGKRLGISLSTTSWKPFSCMIREMAQKGLSTTEGTIRLRLGYTPMVKDTSRWGVLSFGNIAPADI